MRGRNLFVGAAAVLLVAAGLHAAKPAAKPAAVAKPAAIPAYIAAAVASPERPEFDRVRDADRKPAETMAFAGVKPGMHIVELAPGGGYYTRMLSLAVGPQGKIIGISSRALTAVNEWAQTHSQVITMDDAKPGTIPTQSIERVDMVWTTQNYHDFKNAKNGDSDAAAAYNAAAFDVLQPGGIYVIGDHDAAKGADATVTSTLHRIEMATVIKEVEAAGFRLDGQSDILRHPADDHSARVFDGNVRGKTDQFLLRFVKPSK
jgi:predicted methyltransferase